MDIIDEEDKKAAEPYEISIAGFKLKLNNTLFAVALPIVTTLGGISWGAFEFYKDYMDMKQAVQTYVAPDLTDFDKRLSLLEDSSNKQLEYLDSIKGDLRLDIRRVDDISSDVERTSKEDQRLTSSQVREMQAEIRGVRREVEQSLQQSNREQKRELNEIRSEVDSKIKRAIDNPLSNK